MECTVWDMFLLYYPLKQGLKLSLKTVKVFVSIQFLLYYPLKQGLKPRSAPFVISIRIVFTLLSIKTRIETLIGHSS